MMKTYLKRAFQLSDSGVKGLAKSIWSFFLYYVSFVPPMICVFLFADRLLNGNTGKPVVYLLFMLAATLVMYLVINYNYKTTYDETYQESANLRIDLAEQLSKLPLSYFSKHNLSDLAQTIMADVASIEHAFANAVANSIGFAIYFLVISVALLIMNWKLGLCVLLPVLTSASVLFLTKKLQVRDVNKHYDNCSPSTRNQRLSAISAFFKYASQRSISALKICSNIASIPPKKTPRHIFSYFSVEELRVLLQMPDPRKPLERRDIVLLSLLYDSGARAQELCGIRVGDIRFSNPASVLLHGKGGKSRVVPLMNRPTRILQQFIAERKFGTAEKDAPLFLNQRGEPITPACIRNVICKYISRAKNIRPDLFNESSYSPHSFRHSKAVHLLEAGTELVYIRDFLGHVSVQTTEIYATVSQSMLNSVLRNRSIPKVLNVDLNEISHDAIPDYLRKKK